MTGGRRRDAAGRGRAASLTRACLLCAAAVAASIVSAVATPEVDGPWALTASPVWIVLLPIAVAATLVVAARTRFEGDRRLALWLEASAAGGAVYAAAGATCGLLVQRGLTDSWLLSIALAIVMNGWTVVLAVLQGSAIVAGQTVLGRRWARPAPAALVGVAGAVAVLGFVLPGRMAVETFPDMPALLPSEANTSDAAATIIGIVIVGWMASLVVAPVALWIASARSAGVRRHTLARIATGTLLPGLVVMVCGLGATLTPAGGAMELNGLAAGFCAAVPVTAWWLTETVRDALRPRVGAATSVAQIVRVLLWLFYVLAVAQLSPSLGAAFGGGSVAVGALAATALAAATFVPWSLLVRWCLSRIDARAAVAEAAAARPSALSSGEHAQQVLRDALDDDAVAVLLKRPTGWIDVHGEPVTAPSERAGLDAASVVLVPDADAPAGAIVHRSRFLDLRAVVAAVQPLIERAALEAELQEQSARVAAERRRADAAAEQARRRIERDLHDGVQGRLVSLGLGLSLARDDIPDPMTRILLEETVTQLHDAVAELRELSSGTLPARLAGTGLAAAVGDLVQRMPVPVHLDIPALHVADDVGAVAYFVIAEALANAVKHADPTRVEVRVTVGDELVVRVADDGVGGADLRGGSGLRGLQERVHGVGGRLVVSSPAPHGTLVEAVLPCGS